MFEICKVNSVIVEHSIPDEVNCQHHNCVKRIEDKVEDEMRQPEDARWNASHELQVLALFGRITSFGKYLVNILCLSIKSCKLK